MLASIHALLIDVASFTLLTIGIVGVCIAIFFTFLHGDLVSNRHLSTTGQKRVYAEYSKKSGKRYLFTIFIAGATMTTCMLIRVALHGDSFVEYFLGPMLVYRLTIAPSFWIIGYLLPTKEKRKKIRRLIRERKKRIGKVLV